MTSLPRSHHPSGMGTDASTPPPNESELVIVGRIRRSHGVRGDVVVEPLTVEPEVVFAASRRLIGGTARGDPGPRPSELHVAWSERFQKGFRVHFQEIGDRDVADTWRDRYLLLPRSELPPPPEGLVKLEDLIGSRIELPDGQLVGTVQAFYDLPQGIVLEVSRPPADSVLVPYREEFVKRVDVGARLIVIDPPAGLVE